MDSLFFSCDWGTTWFRLRLIDGRNGTVLTERRTGEGIATLAGMESDSKDSLFRTVLETQLTDILDSSELNLDLTPVLISGMASSSMGWKELPYARLPFRLDGSDLEYARLDRPAGMPCRPIFLFSGICGDTEVMRGEEIELMGIAVVAPHVSSSEEETWLVMPGTHSKHVQVRQNTVVEFHTHMTGELFHLLSKQSSLRHREHGQSAGMTSIRDDSRARSAFIGGVQTVRQNGLGATLFQVRTRQLLAGDNHAQSLAFLSGVLIGDELSKLATRIDLNSKIVLAANSELNESYQLAFSELELINRVQVLAAQEIALLSAFGQYQALMNIRRMTGS